MGTIFIFVIGEFFLKLDKNRLRLLTIIICSETAISLRECFFSEIFPSHWTIRSDREYGASCTEVGSPKPKTVLFKGGRMFLSKIRFFALFSLMNMVLLATVWNADAALFSIVFEEPGDFRIEGIVNTTTNTLSVNTWTDLGPNSWTVTSLPRTYTALDSSGSVFDVPDAWDGSIGNTWAFIPDSPENAQTWADGTFVSPNQYYGWGGYDDAGGLGSALTSADEDQSIWFAPRRSTPPATINTDPSPSVSTYVPEPSAYAMSGFALLCCVTAVRFRKRLIQGKIVRK